LDQPLFKLLAIDASVDSDKDTTLALVPNFSNGQPIVRGIFEGLPEDLMFAKLLVDGVIFAIGCHVFGVER
jgi:hypothetical protein